MTKISHRIKMIISDVDGVWTDGTFYSGADGIELKRFSVLDGAGVVFARAAKLKIALISGRYSPATEQRAKELEINDLYNGSLNKLRAYEELKQKYNLDIKNDKINGKSIITEIELIPLTRDGFKPTFIDTRLNFTGNLRPDSNLR